MNERFVANDRSSLYAKSREKTMAEIGEGNHGFVSKEQGQKAANRQQVLGTLSKLSEALAPKSTEEIPPKPMTAQEAFEVMEKALGMNVEVFEKELPLGNGDHKFSARVYKTAEGKVIMSRLPINKYDRETIQDLLNESGARKNFSLPSNWDEMPIDQKIRYLKTFGINTTEDAVNLNALDWGEQFPNQIEKNFSFKDLINIKWRNQLFNHVLPQGIQNIQVINQEITRRITGGIADVEWVMSSAKDLDEMMKQMTVPQLQQLDQVLTPVERNTLDNNKQALDAHFGQLLANLNDVQRRAALGDVPAVASSEVLAVRQGWHSLDLAQRNVLTNANSEHDLPGNDGLRMWYGFSQLEKIRDAFEVYERFQVKTDPIDNIKTAEDVMRFFEKSKEAETFGFARQRLLDLLQAVELTKDPRVTPGMKEILRNRMESFSLVNSLLLTMDRTEGNPGELHKIAVTFQNETVFYFYDRFNSPDIMDKNGNRYLVDVNGNPIEINLAGETENAFFYQYMVDRFRMNRVQELTAASLDVNNMNEDKEWIIRRLIQKNPALGIAVNANLGALNQHQWDSINDLWNRIDDPGFNQNKKGVVNEWYMETTFMGADGYDPGTGILRRDLWRRRIVHDTLRNRMVGFGVDNQRINDLLGQLHNPNAVYDPREFLDANHQIPNPNYNPIVDGTGDIDLVSTVTRNGYDLAKLKYSDTLDRLRLYFNGGFHRDTLFAEDTPYFARVDSNFMDFCLAEFQGDPDINAIVRAVIEERHSSFLLSQNMTAFRLLGVKRTDGTGILPEQNATDIGRVINNEINNVATARGVPAIEVQGEVFVRKLYEGINPDNPDPTMLQLTQVDWGVASNALKSYPIHDMFDDRNKSLAWYMGEFRAWLLHPTDKEFYAMMEKYYSMRNPRRHPGAEDLLMMQWIAGHLWKSKFGYENNITNALMDGFIKRAEELNLIDKGRGKKLRDSLLGGLLSRNAKQLADIFAESLRQTGGSPGWWAGSAWDLIASIAAYSFKQ